MSHWRPSILIYLVAYNNNSYLIFLWLMYSCKITSCLKVGRIVTAPDCNTSITNDCLRSHCPSVEIAYLRKHSLLAHNDGNETLAGSWSVWLTSRQNYKSIHSLAESKKLKNIIQQKSWSLPCSLNTGVEKFRCVSAFSQPIIISKLFFILSAIETRHKLDMLMLIV